MRHRGLGLVAAGWMALSAPALAAEAPRAPRVAVTEHVGHFNGATVPYTATVAETFVNDTAGQPGAAVVTISYERKDVADKARRPVLFLFNGGPGASSSPLHMSALGPALRADAKAPVGAPQWRENTHSPLDVADLVFIDPVNTGFSRSFAGVDPKQWYNGPADAAEVKGVIAEWLKAHGRQASPRYLVGESYGTVRAALIAKSSADLPFDGVLLVALVGDTPGRELPYVAALPTMAAGAWHHRKIARAGRTVGQVYEEALQFARTEYLTALVKGSSLPAAERHRIAVRMSGLIGLPVALIEAEDLRISKNTWMFNILKDKTLRTGLLDVRVTAPLEPGQDGAIDDPALGVAPKRAAGAPAGPPPTPASIGPVPSPGVAAYLTQALRFPASEPYYGVNFTANSQWAHVRNSDANAGLGEAMKANPRMRLFWAAGYYDLTTPAYMGRYSLDHAGIPAERLTAVYFAGPHGVYDGEANLAAFTAAVRKFVAPAAR